MTDSTELLHENLKEIEVCRSRVLDKEFGEKISSEKSSVVKNTIRAELDSAPESSGKFSGLFPQKEPVRIVMDGTVPGELFSVTLYRSHREDGDADEVRVARTYIDPIMEVGRDNQMVPSETRSTLRSDEIQFLMLGNPSDSDPYMWVNIAQEDVDERDRVNVDFVGECAGNGIDTEQLKQLTNDERRKMGMFLVGEADLAKRELRQNPDDLTAFSIIEYALKHGTRVSIDELRTKTASLKPQ